MRIWMLLNAVAIPALWLITPWVSGSLWRWHLTRSRYWGSANAGGASFVTGNTNGDFAG
jgi:hypothetical protein